MGKYFEIYQFEVQITEVEVATKDKTVINDFTIHYPKELEIEFDKVLEPFEFSTTRVFWAIDINIRKQEIPMPWAIIAFDKEYMLADRFIKARGNIFMPFTSYSLYKNGVKKDTPPPISMIFVLKKDDLQPVFEKNTFLNSFWSDLEELDERRHWFYLADALPEE